MALQNGRSWRGEKKKNAKHPRQSTHSLTENYPSEGCRHNGHERICGHFSAHHLQMNVTTPTSLGFTRIPNTGVR